MISKDKLLEIVEYSFSNGEQSTLEAFSLSKETFNRYMREYRKHYGESGELLIALKKKFTAEELKELSKKDVLVPTYKRNILSFDGDDIVFGAFTDTHIGSNYTDESYISSAIEEFKKQGCQFIVHAGDITEGMSGRDGHVYELSHCGYKAQKEAAINLLKEWDKTAYYIAGNHDCLDSETECLTDSGWKSYKELAKTDKILSYDVATDSCSWDSINEIIVQHRCEEMVKFGINGYNFFGTKKHRVLAKKQNASAYAYFEADMEANTKVQVKTASTMRNVDIAVSDDMIRVVSWILSDGSINRAKDTHAGTYTIWQSKHIDAIECALDACNIQYTKRTRKRDIDTICGIHLKKAPLPETSFTITGDSVDRIKELIPTKEFPKWIYDLSDRQFNIFMDIVRDANGSTCKNYKYPMGYAVYGTEFMLNQLQILCSLHGQRAWIKKDTRGNYKLNITPTKDTVSFMYKQNKKYEQYTGEVWCLSVPKTNFMVRRNGTAYFTGNCWYMQKGDMGADIVADICDALPNSVYLGMHEGDINVNGVTIRLWHGADGSSSTHSYRIQQILGSLDVQSIPDILIAGHSHKNGYFYDRGCHALTAGCLQKQSGFMRYKRLPAHVGFYVIRMKVRNGKLITFSPTYYPLAERSIYE
jgi:predicted phosphodiesterase